jgi:hypothetical protein
MKRFLCAFICLLWPTLGSANSFGTDLSDLWYLPTESGWGVNVIHQGDVLFVTFFVYGSSGAPIWYSASETRYSTTLASGSLVFTGPLYQTGGPWFGGSFNPANVSYRQVGTVTFTASSVSSGTLSYSVDGIVVQKNIARATWRANEISGSYVGATVGTYSSCNPASANGYAEDPAYITIAQSGTNATIQVVGQSATCSYSGPYVQEGRMGSISGAYACSNGAAGTFNAFEIEVNSSTFSARATAKSQFCNFAGRVGGVRRGS